jgi:hypothetical protein
MNITIKLILLILLSLIVIYFTIFITFIRSKNFMDDFSTKHVICNKQSFYLFYPLEWLDYRISGISYQAAQDDELDVINPTPPIGDYMFKLW